jgi:hypothetical protein
MFTLAEGNGRSTSSCVDYGRMQLVRPAGLEFRWEHLLMLTHQRKPVGELSGARRERTPDHSPVDAQESTDPDRWNSL